MQVSVLGLHTLNNRQLESDQIVKTFLHGQNYRLIIALQDGLLQTFEVWSAKSKESNKQKSK